MLASAGVIRIRFAQHEDVATLSGLHAASFLRERSWSAEEFTELMGTDGTIVSLAESDNVPAGFIVYRVLPGEAEILTLAVAPPFRRQGVARALVQKMLTHVQIGRRGEPVAKVFLEVAEDNAAARTLYAGFGFAEISRRAGYYQRPGGITCDAVVMARALA